MIIAENIASDGQLGCDLLNSLEDKSYSPQNKTLMSKLLEYPTDEIVNEIFNKFIPADNKWQVDHSYFDSFYSQLDKLKADKMPFLDLQLVLKILAMNPNESERNKIKSIIFKKNYYSL